MRTPLDGFHLVSGNREFGIFANPGNNGYTFYTMVVDRTSLGIFSIANIASTLFEKADELWSNMIKNMKAYMANNGITATINTPVKARPYYNHVDRYLRGVITFTALKKLLGCF